jgi:hypothetical protein
MSSPRQRQTWSATFLPIDARCLYVARTCFWAIPQINSPSNRMKTMPNFSTFDWLRILG